MAANAAIVEIAADAAAQIAVVIADHVAVAAEVVADVFVDAAVATVRAARAIFLHRNTLHRRAVIADRAVSIAADSVDPRLCGAASLQGLRQPEKISSRLFCRANHWRNIRNGLQRDHLARRVRAR